MTRAFSESRRRSAHIVLYRREDTEVRVSVAVDYILHHDFLVDMFD